MLGVFLFFHPFLHGGQILVGCLDTLSASFFICSIFHLRFTGRSRLLSLGSYSMDTRARIFGTVVIPSFDWVFLKIKSFLLVMRIPNIMHSQIILVRRQRL